MMLSGVCMKGESKEERFKRVAQKRIQSVLHSIRGLSQCSNRRMYEWNDEQVKKMWDAIDIELITCKKKFKDSKPEEFRF